MSAIRQWLDDHQNVVETFLFIVMLAGGWSLAPDVGTFGAIVFVCTGYAMLLSNDN